MSQNNNSNQQEESAVKTDWEEERAVQRAAIRAHIKKKHRVCPPGQGYVSRNDKDEALEVIKKLEAAKIAGNVDKSNFENDAQRMLLEKRVGDTPPTFQKSRFEFYHPKQVCGGKNFG